jgi:hypothetical protein
MVPVDLGSDFVNLDADRERNDPNWMRNAGIVLLSAAAYGAFGVFSMNAIAVSREFATVFPGNRLRFLCDYHTGVTCLIVMIAAGVLLLFGAKRATT